MARLRDIQTAQYKFDKTSGLTSAKNFKEWLEAEKAMEAMMQESAALQSLKDLSILEVFQTVEAAIEVVDTAANIHREVVIIKKSAIALDIYNREQEAALTEERIMNRKNVISQFVSIAGLTLNGANTYYQNIRRKKGIIGS